jgi:RNA polymerase sigma factor (sigma-70 family)
VVSHAVADGVAGVVVTVPVSGAASLGCARVLPLPSVWVPRDSSDEQLVALVRAGSDAAFGAIDERYRRQLLVFARRMLGGRGDAEDVLQDVYVRAHSALIASDRPMRLGPWLYRIARNRCLDELRRRHALPLDRTPAAAAVLAHAPLTMADTAAVAECAGVVSRMLTDIERLPERQRTALLLRELQGCSYTELAHMLGVSVAAVKSLLLRARSELRARATARESSCSEIRRDLDDAAGRGARPDERARHHCADCASCTAHHAQLVSVERRRRERALAAGRP